MDIGRSLEVSMRKLIRQLPMFHPGMHALSHEMAMEDLKSRDCGHGVVNGRTKEVLGE